MAGSGLVWQGRVWCGAIGRGKLWRGMAGSGEVRRGVAAIIGILAAIKLI